MRGVERLVCDVLDRRLLPASDRPLAVALSGGGDSLALTLIANTWAREHGRELLILTVDHRLQADAGAWVETCRTTAARLGRPFQALVWEGPKPATGLPAAARTARHRLLADAAREAGAGVILMGHTADDIAESQAMRAAGSTTPDPQEWAPSPAWPEGRRVFLLRPMLSVDRYRLREWLSAKGETWIEDPANGDLRYARARARRAGPADRSPTSPTQPLTLAEAMVEAGGAFALPRRAARAAEHEEFRRLLGIACVCAGGKSRPPDRLALERLAEKLTGDDPVFATLAGAKIEARDDLIRIGREAGRHPAVLDLESGMSAVWDGRFELVATAGRHRIVAMVGHAARLRDAERRLLDVLPPMVRHAVPVRLDQPPTCPLYNSDAGVRARSIIGERMRAACGLIQREIHP